MKKSLTNKFSTTNVGDKKICYECIGESFLSKLVEKKGKRGKCSYCRITSKAISVEELANRIQKVIDQFYQRTSDNPSPFESAMQSDKESGYWWQRDGELIVDVIEEVAGISTQAAVDVQSILYDRFSSRSSEEIGEETEFEIESQYEYIGISSQAWEERWVEFEKSLKSNTRYFNQLGKEYLDEVFKDIHKLRTIDGNAVIIAGPDQPLRSAYRARVFLSDQSLHNALLNIGGELGPTASHIAKAGRMNAAGISVFYGATNELTAITEVRPPVGSKVAVAKFNFVRKLQLLNLVELGKIDVDGSLFNEEHAALLSRVQFLKQLCQKMTIPVMPGEEDIAYLVTQAIADYLSMDERLNLDGIIFPSIQTTTGSNIVLFHKASKVRPKDIPPGTKVTASLWGHDEDGPYPSFSIMEETPREKIAEDFPFFEDDPRTVSLMIDDQDIKIHIVQAVEYKTEPHRLSVDRHEKIDFSELESQLGIRKTSDW